METPQVPFLPSKRPHRRGEVLRHEVFVAFPIPPNVVDGLPDSLSQVRAFGICIRSIVGQGEIKLQNLGGKGLDRGVLSCIDAVRRPDQEAHGQRREQRQEADDRADHVTRAAGRECLGQHALENKADSAPGENHQTDAKRELFRTYGPPRAESASYPLRIRKATASRAHFGGRKSALGGPDGPERCAAIAG